MGSETDFMKRAMDLARLGLGKVSPNPMVGCVITYQNKIIGEGFHQYYGGPHAEVEAIKKVTNKEILKECTVYVSLEPCSHHGKTPPCADLLASFPVKEVIIANTDVNPLVSGKGVQKLKKAGVFVKTGIMESLGYKINKRFFTFFEKKRPYIILKWAETADGYIAKSNYDSKWISNEFSRMFVHKWRSQEAGVLVGTNTGYYDNPKLNVRAWSGNNPARIVLDRNLRLKSSLHLFDQNQPTLVYNCIKDEEIHHLKYVKLGRDNFFRELLDDLFSKGIQSLLVEGGAAIANEFIKENLWDEARIFKAPVLFGDGIKAPLLLNYQVMKKRYLLDDELIIYKNQDNIYN